MELLVIRHGLPLRIERDDGEPADPELSELGQRQADRIAEWLSDEPIGRPRPGGGQSASSRAARRTAGES